MSPDPHHWAKMPLWCWMVPLAACALLGAKMAGLVSAGSIAFIIPAIILLGAVVFVAVHHAEVVAVKVGEPFGSIVLALAITVIEVGLIVSVMVSGAAGSEEVARDTVFAAVMIVLNGIVGLSLLLGGIKHHEQEFQIQGATAILAVIATLAILTLVLPNYTLTTPGPVYSAKQLVFVGCVSLVLYLVFVFIQTVRHKDYFLIEGAAAEHDIKPSGKATLLSCILMVISLFAVVLLAKALSPLVDSAVLKAGLPAAFVGVIIASIVLLPEGVTSLKLAGRNRLQPSMNAALGSALATIGLTIPAVAAVSIYLGQKLVLGLEPEKIVLLVLTLFISTLTFATGRTTVLHGAVHLVIFGVFMFLSAVP